MSARPRQLQLWNADWVKIKRKRRGAAATIQARIEAAAARSVLPRLNADADRGKHVRAVDAFNGRYGCGAVQLAGAGLAGEARLWATTQEHKTPNYTTSWTDLPIARA